MKGTFYFLFFCAGWVVFQGCTSINQEEKKRQVEGLLARKQSLSARLEKAFPDNLSEQRLEMMQTEQVIKNNYLSDTIHSSFAKDMNDFKRNRKAIGKLNKEYLTLKRALTDEGSRLKDLLDDMLSGAGEVDNYSRYIAQETNNLNTVEKTINEFVAKIKAFEAMKKQLSGRVSPVANKLLNH